MEQNLLNMTEYAKHRNCSLGSVQKAIADGRITVAKQVGKRKFIDQVQADMNWPLANSVDTATGGLQKAREKKEWAIANIRELEFAQKQGELIPIEDVAKIVRHEYAIVRQRLLTIPVNLATTLCHIEDPAEVQEVLLESINEALEQLSSDAKFESEASDDSYEDASSDAQVNASGVGGEESVSV